MPSLRIHEVVRAHPELLEKFRSFRTPDVANALGPKTELMNSLIRPVWQCACFGNALTVQTGPDDNFGVAMAALLAKPGDVIVVASGAEYTGAMVGGLIARIAKSRGVTGFVVDGSVRDVVDFENLGMPVFARSISPRRAGKEGPATLGGRVNCGGIAVRSGDIVIADSDGVAIVPAHELAATQMLIEQAMVADKKAENDFDLLLGRFEALLNASEIERLPPE